MNRAALTVLALLACGASAAVTVTPADVQTRKSKSAKPATHTVTIDATRFSPETLTIKPGDTVVWINKDLIPHTASSQGFDSGTILAGESWRYTFKSKGELSYACLFHPTMKATLRIR